MAIAMGFESAGNKNQGFSGQTGGGSVNPLQLKMGQDGKLGLVNDGSGGFLNYLKGLAAPAATGAVTGAAAPAATGAVTGAAAPAAAGASSGLLGGGL